LPTGERFGEDSAVRDIRSAKMTVRRAFKAFGINALIVRVGARPGFACAVHHRAQLGTFLRQEGFGGLWVHDLIASDVMG